MDHTNLAHRRAFEAKEFLQYIYAGSMRHHPTGPTWRSHGFYKCCDCQDKNCKCPKKQRTGAIDNVFYSLDIKVDVEILEDFISDHSPLFLKMEIDAPVKSSVLKTIWRRNLKNVSCSVFESALDSFDWSPIYSMNDVDTATAFLTNNVLNALDIVAPLKPFKIRPDKAPLSLKKDTLKVIAMRDRARKSKNRGWFKSLRNKANKLVKRDKVRSVLHRIKENPGSKQTWNEAKTILGRGPGSNMLPLVTTNSDPNETANTQNEFFVEKISKLVKGIKKLYKCGICNTKFEEKSNLDDHVNLIHESLKGHLIHSSI